MKPVQLEAFIDPTPISSMNCSPGAMEDEVGGSFTDYLPGFNRMLNLDPPEN